jgi:hypothetical protein
VCALSAHRAAPAYDTHAIFPYSISAMPRSKDAANGGERKRAKTSARRESSLALSPC